MTDTYFEVPRFDEDDDDPLNPSEDKWTLARDLFTSGHTGDAVCAALGIRRSTFWRRAARESWLRRDGPRGATAPEPLDLEAPVDDSASALDKVWRRVCLALDTGRSADALRWIRIHTLLRTQADADRRHQSRETLRDMDAILRTTKGIKAAAEAELVRRKTVKLEKGDSTPTESHPADADTPGRGPCRATAIAEIGQQTTMRLHRPPFLSSSSGPRACAEPGDPAAPIGDLFTRDVRRRDPRQGRAPARRWVPRSRCARRRMTKGLG